MHMQKSAHAILPAPTVMLLQAVFMRLHAREQCTLWDAKTCLQLPVDVESMRIAGEWMH
jgi:hypothetical protein